MSNVQLYPRTLDQGLVALDTEATHIYLVTAEPSDFSNATTNSPTGAALGNKDFGGAGNVCGSPAAGTPDGRKVTVNAVSGGSITANGTPTRWVITDNTNSRILVTGTATGFEAVTSGQSWNLASFDIQVPAT